MQKTLTEEKTKDFFNSLKTQTGNIINKEFLEYNKTYALYKTNFEKGTVEMQTAGAWVDDMAPNVVGPDHPF